jgi:hypothetical protein
LSSNARACGISAHRFLFAFQRRRQRRRRGGLFLLNMLYYAHAILCTTTTPAAAALVTPSPRHRRGKFPALSGARRPLRQRAARLPHPAASRSCACPALCCGCRAHGAQVGFQFPSRSVLPAGPTPGAPTPPPKPLLPSRTKAPRAWLLCAMPQLLQPGAANAAGLPLRLAPLSVGKSTHERYRAKRPHTPHKPCPQARAF